MLVKKIRRLKDPTCFPQWVYRIATARCADWVRMRQRDHRLHKSLSDNPTAVDVRANDNAGSHANVLRHAMRQLPVEKQIILSLFYVEGFSTKEIADILHLALGTIKSRLYSAREHLKTIIERSDP